MTTEKRKSAIILFILSLLAPLSISAQSLLPPSVQQFLNEQRYSKQYKAAMSEANDDMCQFVSPRMVDGVEMVDAFIAIDGETVIPALEREGVVVNSVFDGFVTAQIPMARIEQISRLHGVKDVEVSRRLKLCTDTTLSITHAGQVIYGNDYGLPFSYDGSGVIVGVIDGGFDFQHRAFRSNDDPTKTRIVRVYNTQVKTGHPALYNKFIKLPGSVFMGNEIYTLTTDKNNSTHGTHTASIAAGSHVYGYGGMAPGADIVLCAVSVLSGSMSAVEVANCVRYIDAYADSVGQPCVMSLSVSTPNGQHDGLDYLSKVVKQVTGPGRIFVIAAGNNAGNMPYAHGKSDLVRPFSLMFKYKNNLGDSTYYYGGILADVWIRNQSTNFYYRFHVLDVITGNIVWQSSLLQSKAEINYREFSDYYTYYSASDTTGYIETETSYNSDGKKYRLEVNIHNLLSTKYFTVSGTKRSRYALGLEIYPRKDITIDVDAWSCNSGSRFGTFSKAVNMLNGNSYLNFYSPPSDSCCIGSYAVGDSTISAGAYSGRNSYYSMSGHKVVTDNSIVVGDIASFSSYQIAGSGPTGEALPTICAPGTLVVAAGSRYSYFNGNSSSTVMRDAEGNSWGVMSGTSMAAPTVAGIIALWLQADPTLTVARAKSVLAESAIHDHYTQGANRDHFGPNGKINALEGINIIRKSLVPKYTLGDVNDDGAINVLDITLLIHYLLDEDTNIKINELAADIDDNGSINVGDLNYLILIVINGNKPH